MNLRFVNQTMRVVLGTSLLCLSPLKLLADQFTSESDEFEKTPMTRIEHEMDLNDPDAEKKLRSDLLASADASTLKRLLALQNEQIRATISSFVVATAVSPSVKDYGAIQIHGQLQGGRSAELFTSIFTGNPLATLK